MHGIQLAGIRQLLGGSILVLFFLMKKEKLPNFHNFKIIFFLSILNFVLSNGLSSWGVTYISSGLGAIIGCIFPLWIFIYLSIINKNTNYKGLLGVLFANIGVGIIFNEYLKDFVNPKFIFGILLVVCSTITWAWGSIYTKKNIQNFNPYFGLGIQMFVSGILLTIIAESTGVSIPIADIPANSWFAIFYLIIFGSMLTFMAFIYSLKNLPLEISSIYAYINPIVAVILGVVLYKEPFTLAILIGSVTTLFGLYVINKSIKN
jgi:drug/metabolite transporter (DMT)-like permease